MIYYLIITTETRQTVTEEGYLYILLYKAQRQDMPNQKIYIYTQNNIPFIVCSAQKQHGPAINVMS